ncbi:hypothetical protein A6770_17775 [Nostoc minutum NIES-26]|uniref:Uncharacterized protein n=1 Tax=Nostoc minutum NIES-26 TaxID=1844469 RepID=A0A367RCD3_9NOSO|nr:hypothetical protein A6770_17775 [Nostoc minutum NIES-26]
MLGYIFYYVINLFIKINSFQAVYYLVSSCHELHTPKGVKKGQQGRQCGLGSHATALRSQRCAEVPSVEATGVGDPHTGVAPQVEQLPWSMLRLGKGKIQTFAL